MQPCPVGERDLRELLDRVDDTVRKARGGPDDCGGVAVDQFSHGDWIDPVVFAQGRAAHLEVHRIRRLVERGVDGDRHDDVQPCPGALPDTGAVRVSGRLHRDENALTATRGESPCPAFGRVEEIEPEVQHVLFHRGDPEEGALATEGVLAETLEIGVPPDLVGGLIVAEYKQRRPPVAPGQILTRTGTDLGLQVGPATARGGKGRTGRGHGGILVSILSGNRTAWLAVHSASSKKAMILREPSVRSRVMAARAAAGSRARRASISTL